MNISIGTPPVTVVAIADTGSDITWTQCQPCTNCFKQNFPLFNPQNSSTYKNLPCLSKLCQAFESSSCSKNSCKYRASYGDQSYSNGDLAVDTFTFGSSSKQPVSIPAIGFGCGHDDGGNFNELTSGIVGLGGGPLSIVNQLSEKIDGKFSYCLIPISKGSKVSSTISFGSNAIVSGPGVVSTPLVDKDPVTYYYLSLDSVSVGDSNLKFKTNSNSGGDLKAEEQEGNIIIDSGTTITFLPSKFYDKFLQEVSNAISATSIADPEGLFNLCYKDEEGFELLVPKITFHFRGADLNLQPSSTFLEVEKGVFCLVINPSDELAIFGNLSQMDFLIGYDLVNKMVSFKRTDCTKQ